MSSIFGFDVIESPLLPIPPNDAQVARRIVRHGLADVLEWLGEDVGPKPDDRTLIIVMGGRTTVFCSESIVGTLREEADR